MSNDEAAPLPFLIVHGALVWKVALVVLAAALLVPGWALRKALARRVAHRSVRAMTAHVTSPCEGIVVLRGVLRGGEAMTLSHEAARAASHASPGLWLECDGVRVELAGTIVVEHGTRVTQGLVLHPKGTPAVLQAQPPELWIPRRLAVVSDGDAVLITGDVKPTAIAEAGYRERVGSWIMTGSDEPIRIVAVTPSAPARRHGLHGFTLLPVLAVLITYGALDHLGGRMLAAAEERTFGLSELHPYAIAAALPNSREDALQSLQSRTARIPNDPERFAVRRSLVRFREGCGAEAHLLADMNRLEEAVVLADRCGERELATTTLVWLGRYNEAAVRQPTGSPYRDGLVYIGTGDWTRAAVVAERLFAKQQTTDEYGARTAANQECLSLMFRSWSGDAAAAERLAEIAEARKTPTCALALGVTLPTRGRYQVTFDLIPEDAHRAREVAFLLGLANGERVVAPEDHASAILFQDIHQRTAAIAAASYRRQGRDDSFAAWLAPSIVEHWGTARPMDPQATAALELGHSWHVVRALRIGDQRAAVAHLTAAEALIPPNQRLLLEGLRTAVALHAPETTLPGTHREHDRFEVARAVRLGWDVPRGSDLHGYPEDCGPQLASAFREAQAGDGRPLAAAFAECSVHEDREGLLPAVLPRITRGRDELAALLRLPRDSYARERIETIPFAWVDNAATQRDLMRFAGDAGETARWQRIVEAHAEVLSDRRKLIAFLLWNVD